MTEHDSATSIMRTVRFHEYGAPGDVLHLETVPVPVPGPGRVRVAVHACGLAPADWALCRGLFPGNLPRGIGCDVSGTVDAVGDDVTDVKTGDVVFGTTDWAHSSSAGASDRAVMNRWFRVPDGLDLEQAAALPMTVDTAFFALNALGFDPDKTILIHGAGTTIGFAAVQIALLRGMRVIATAGETYAQRLRALGAQVTAYGDGMVERVTEINGGPADLVLNTAPVGGSLRDLVQIAAGDPKRVLTISDFAAAAELGVRDSFHEDRSNPVEALPEFGQLAADGVFTVPIAATFPLDEWKTALEISQTGHARGKLLLLPGTRARVTEEQGPVPAPDPGYAGADFDRYFDEAARSPLLGEMFREHFDSTDPGEVQGFNYVPMTGLERIAELLSGSGDGLLLDAACGRGGPGIWLARRIGRPLHGVDISRVAIEQARGLAVRQGARATFSEGTLNDTRLDDACYPALVCLDALHFAADPAAAARELRRVAQPGGLLVVTTWQTDNGPPRLRRDIRAALQEAGWSILCVEDHPDWLAAQLRLYEAALAAASWRDPAVQRLRDEGEAVAPAIRGGRRLLIQARRS